MGRRLGLLHTAQAHVATFDGLLRERAPGVAAEHLVDEGLLARARAEGLTDAVAADVAAALGRLAEAGAGAVLCTCSTIGAAAERLGTPALPVVRVDRPMAARAVALGGRVTVLATLESTLGPTRLLIEDEAARAGRPVEVREALVAGAWERFAAGDLAGYLALVAEAIRAAPAADALVLAQASMAPAADMAEGPGGAPVLSSPRIGLGAALAALGAAG